MPVALWGTGVIHRLLSSHFNWFIYAGICILGSIAFGIVMAILIEFPVLRIRDRFFPSRATAQKIDSLDAAHGSLISQEGYRAEKADNELKFNTPRLSSKT